MDASTRKAVEQMIIKIVQAKLDDFFQKNVSFRARKLGDGGTDSNQMATNGGSQTIATNTVNQAVANYLPLAGGTLTDGANIRVGTVTGTKIGTAANQKLGFYGKGPIIQQTNTAGAVTAGATYTATEQAMLNDCYSVLRNIGILS